MQSPRARSLAVLWSRGTSAFALAALVACGAGPQGPHSTTAQTGACDGAHLDACEVDLATARANGAPLGELVQRYVDARAARSASDGWAKLHHDLKEKKSKVAVVVEGGAAPSLTGAVTVQASLPKPEKISPNELLLAIGEAASVDFLVEARADGVLELFPADPLGPMLGGLPAVAHAEPKSLESDRAIDAGVRSLAKAMSEARYVDASKLADELEAKLTGRDTNDEPVLRARFLLNSVNAAGAVLDKPEQASASVVSFDLKADETPPPPAPRASDTPYGDFLRVRTSKDDKADWAARGAKIVAAFPADRRDDVTELYGAKKGCTEPHRAPPMAGARDLLFAYKLSGALASETMAEAEVTARGLLPLADWMRRYEALVGFVEQTKTGWFYASTLVYQRGEMLGLSPAGTSVYKRVSAIVLEHLKAAHALESADPAGFRAMNQLGFVFGPGAIGDPLIRQAVTELAESTVRDKLSRAHDADKIFEGVAMGVLAGMTYPAPIQAAQYLALQGAFATKVKGDLLTQTGWGAAGLFAADAIYRTLTDQAPNPEESARQIARALETDKALSHKELAPLAVSVARYAALAVAKKLDLRTGKADRLSADRKAAQAALREALAGLGAPGEAPNNVLDDTTELADGLLATLAVSVSRPAKPTPAGTCAAKETSSLDADTRRALAKLGDVRRRILAAPRFKSGDGAWVRRVRLLVTLISDAMDIALAEHGKKPTFSIPSADGARYVDEGLRDLTDAKLAAVARDVFGAYRGIITAKGVEDVLQAHGRELERALSGLVGYFASDAATGVGVALVDALAKIKPSAVGDDLPSALTSYASGFYARKQRDQGDLFLLGALLTCSLAGTLPPKATLELAAANASRIRWGLLALDEELEKKKRGLPPDPAVFGDEMRKVTDDSCARPDIEEVVTTMAAIHDFSAGNRKEGRASLEKVLDRMETKGLFVPKVVYHYLEQTASKLFTVNVGLAMTAGLLHNANTFQIGVGFASKQQPKGTLTATFDAQGTPQAGEEAARVYVHAAALASVYAFLDGDAQAGEKAARRAASAALQGVRLGDRPLKASEPATYTRDARAALAVAAELAGEAGRPLLAGDLFAIVKPAFGSEVDDATIAKELTPPPTGLAGIDDAKPVFDRTTKTLRVLLLALPCTNDKIELSGYEEPSCDAYPIAVGLRVADALKKLPRLKRGSDTGPGCSALRGLDAFFGAANQGRYDPDLFTAAVVGLRSSGKLYDASVLLTRQRQPQHCSPAILEATRALGRNAALGSPFRADLLTIAVNCASQPIDAAASDDLIELDAQLKALADPTRDLGLALSLADTAVRTDAWDVLGKLVDQSDFVTRWRSVPLARTAAQVIQDAVRAASGKPPSDTSLATYDLVCERFPPGERAPLCASLKAIRAPTKSPDEAKTRAKEALRDLVKAFTSSK